jgi:hypothetical protein
VKAPAGRDFFWAGQLCSVFLRLPNTNAGWLVVLEINSRVRVRLGAFLLFSNLRSAASKSNFFFRKISKYFMEEKICVLS